jgi:hypothetical protein
MIILKWNLNHLITERNATFIYFRVINSYADPAHVCRQQNSTEMIANGMSKRIENFKTSPVRATGYIMSNSYVEKSTKHVPALWSEDSLDLTRRDNGLPRKMLASVDPYRQMEATTVKSIHNHRAGFFNMKWKELCRFLWLHFTHYMQRRRLWLTSNRAEQ